MNIRDQIDAYLGNELSEADKLSFENELSSNPELQQELNFQQDVIEGIKEARKAELKTMLNNVPVGGSSVGFTGSTMQYIGAALITIVIGFGIVYFWPEGEEPISDEITEVEAPEVIDETVNIPSTSGEESIPVIENDNEEVVDETNSATEEIPQIVEPANDTEAVEEKLEDIPVSTEDARPSIVEGFDTEDGSEHDIPENNLGKSTYSSGSVDVEINSSIKKYDFHYQFINSRLVLYGDFNETYEIMDLIKDDKRALYLYYKDKYYQLTLNQSDVKQLETITDASAVKELENIRKER